ncbi:aminotransferase class V-fold PLP-dependent enzyme [Sessilibacter sp. MAH2]
MTDILPFRQSPNAIAHCYQNAQVDLKLMLTGHVHQAIPDVAQKAYQEHWQCLSQYGSERFDMLFDKSWLVRQGFAELIDTEPERIALASSVHELFVRFLSCLDLKKRPRILTTHREHPSILRQLIRLKEQGCELVFIDSDYATLVEKISQAIDDKTAAVCISSVNYVTGHQTFELDTLPPICANYGTELFVDAYQSVNVLEFSIADYNLETAFVAAGGGKYCQMGDGVCFMHVPEGSDFRPVITGWFGSFDPVLDSPAAEPLVYADGACRFDGSTTDALPHFRAEKVFEHFKREGLTPELLYEINHHQLGYLVTEFLRQDFDPKVIRMTSSVEYMGGFVSFATRIAQPLHERMRDIGVICDYREDFLRLGPAPYLCDEQLRDSITAMKEALVSLGY